MLVQPKIDTSDSADAAPKPTELKESIRVYKASGQAFELIHKHKTPPTPMAYAVWYAYAAKSPEIVAEKIDARLELDKGIDLYDLEQIYDEHLKDTSGSEQNKAISKGFEDNLEKVNALLTEGLYNNDAFQARLGDVSDKLPDGAEPEELQGVLADLIGESQKMASLTHSLSSSLEQSQAEVKKLSDELERVRMQSLMDPLTSIANRRAFESRILAEVDLAESTGSKFCLVLADIDKFKTVNDTFGHQIGDQVLQSFAQTMVDNTKGQDLVARFGGDEFAVILPETDIINAYNLMVAIKRKFTSLDFSPLRPDLDQEIVASASFGISMFKPGKSVKQMVLEADTQLNKSKTAGRNRVCADNI